MATLADKIGCERRVRDWLDENGVSQPTSVEYGFACIRLFWADANVALVVDLTEPPDGGTAMALREAAETGDEEAG